MKVITGKARGRKLETPKGNNVRPTTDMVKQAMFSIIQFDIEGRRVLDLFAGSGQLGIEALSRGAASAVFVDRDKNAVNVVKKNIEHVGFADVATLVQSDATSFLSLKQVGTEKFDLIFLDPPYGNSILQNVLPQAAKVLASGGIAVCESAALDELPETVGTINLIKHYKYGKTKISIYR